MWEKEKTKVTDMGERKDKGDRCVGTNQKIELNLGRWHNRSTSHITIWKPQKRNDLNEDIRDGGKTI